MNNINCDLLHKEYKDLKQKILILGNSEKFKSYNFIDARDMLRMGEIARGLVTKHPDYVKTLSAANRLELKNDPAVENIMEC